VTGVPAREERRGGGVCVRPLPRPPPSSAEKSRAEGRHLRHLRHSHPEKPRPTGLLAGDGGSRGSATFVTPGAPGCAVRCARPVALSFSSTSSTSTSHIFASLGINSGVSRRDSRDTTCFAVRCGVAEPLCSGFPCAGIAVSGRSCGSFALWRGDRRATTCKALAATLAGA
jgi:hypothetical protein